MPGWVAALGMLGCMLLGAGVFGTWIADPLIEWASYLVAAGGFCLGGSLWFGQPPEIAVAVGDAGVAVEYGRQTTRVHWYDMRSLRTKGGRLVIEGPGPDLKFAIGANPSATAFLLKEAAERVPDVMDIDPSVTKRLPELHQVRGLLQGIEDEQVAGTRCAASQELIQLEEEARLCPRCGQIYLREHVPAQCVSCEMELGNETLLA